MASHICTLHTSTMQGLYLPPTYHSIPPLFVCFCTSALQCSWVDLMISTAKSYKKNKEYQKKICFVFLRDKSISTNSDNETPIITSITPSCLMWLLQRSSYFVFELSVESKLVLRLSIRHFIFPEPVDGGL